MKRFVLCVFALIACHFSRPQFSSLVDAVRSGDVAMTFTNINGRPRSCCSTRRTPIRTAAGRTG